MTETGPGSEVSGEAESLSPQQEFEDCKAEILAQYGEHVNSGTAAEDLVFVAELDKGEFLEAHPDPRHERDSNLITTEESYQLFKTWLVDGNYGDTVNTDRDQGVKLD